MGKRDERLLQRMMALHQSGRTLTRIGELVGLSTTVVWTRLQAAGVDTRGLGRPHRSRTVTSDVRRKIIALYQSGHSIAQVAKLVGLSWWTVRKCLEAASTSMRQHSVSPDAARRMVELYQAGHSVMQVAKLVGRNYVTVSKFLKAAGVPMRPPGVPKGFRHPESAYVRDVKKRLLAGDSISVIALDYGVTRQAISALAKVHGFSVRELRYAGSKNVAGGARAARS